MRNLSNRSRRLLAGTALCMVVMAPAAVWAQGAAADEAQIAEIIVTAQKREQSVRDVPIAVTALSQDMIQANRIASVADLSGMAPGVQVRPTAGGTQLPSFTIRGAVSYGVVPGSDKQVSMYLDGVYISSPRGSIFELPDTQRIEILRGPQGTLFGRNATAGAVSIVTRDPTGEMGINAGFTYGNLDRYRMQVSVNTPQVGPFSAYLTYAHHEHRGDIRNANADQVWDRSRSSSDIGVLRSPKWLGSKNADSWFAAVKFEPSDSFQTVYKFDRTVDHGTPQGTAFVGYNKAHSAALTGSLVEALINSQPTPVYTWTDGKRPSIVNNGFAVPSEQKVSGHNLTSTLRLTDNLSIKNIFAYRKTYMFAAVPFDGLSGLTFTQQALIPYATFLAFSANPALAAPNADPAARAAAIQAIATPLAARIGQPFVLISGQNETFSSQYSDELQINYDSSLLTLTAGALWFKSKDRTGGPRGMQGTLSFAIVPSGTIPLGTEGVSVNRATSLAAYAQAELHVSPQVDIIAGARITRDKKSGEFIYGTAPALTTVPFTYRHTRPNYLIGVNYKPNYDVLLYGKFSTAFVSGGSAGGIAFEPETAESWEAGVKASLLGNRLQTNLAVYTVTYKNFQAAQSTTTFGSLVDQISGIPGYSRVLGQFVLNQGGPVKNTGFEFDFMAAPVRGITTGGSLSHSKTTFHDVLPILITANGGGFLPTLRPSWTAGLWGQYESPAFAGSDTRLVLRADANWRSKQRMDTNPNRDVPAYAVLEFAPAAWTVNARAAIKDIELGEVTAELAVWGRNLTNDRSRTFQLINSNFQAAANFVPARTYGVDLNVEF
jgi:iron complex outermembrane receptor protein